MHQPPPESPGRLARWRVTEPVRLYLWPQVLAVALLLAAAVWHRPTLWLPAVVVVVCLTGSIEAVRASVLSPAQMVRSRSGRG